MVLRSTVLRSTRRWVALVCVTTALIGCSHTPTRPSSARAATVSAAEQRAASPAAVLVRLQEGNRRWVENRGLPRDWPTERRLSAAGQHPLAAVLTCLDSRTPPELIFDQGLGDLFVGRVAGNVITDELLGSLEFATRLAGARLIVVLGHDHCGAIKGACDGAELGHLTGLLERIRPAVDAVSGYEVRTSASEPFVAAVTEANVRLAVERIRRDSPVLSELIAGGGLDVVGALYELETGVVRWVE